MGKVTTSNKNDEDGLDRETSDAADRLARALMGVIRVEAIDAASSRERYRVDALLARDAEDAAAEQARQAATIELADGLTVNVVDTVVPPTPEWLAKTSTRTVYVGADNWTDRSAHEPLKTVRRIAASMAFRIHSDGRINERQFKACVWYRDRYELAGLDGNMKTASFEPRISGGSGSGLPFSDVQIEAQDEYRNARIMVPMLLRAFFELVVIDDMSLTAAKKNAPAGKSALDSFKCCADRVADYIEFSSGKRL